RRALPPQPPLGAAPAAVRRDGLRGRRLRLPEAHRLAVPRRLHAGTRDRRERLPRGWPLVRDDRDRLHGRAAPLGRDGGGAGPPSASGDGCARLRPPPGSGEVVSIGRTPDMGRAPSTEELPLLLGGLLSSAPDPSENADEPRIVSFGGGHGLYAALRAFRLITENLTAVVTVADDGGSSGRLREEMGGLPPGDLRMALAALCDDGEWGRVWRGVMQHRFVSKGALDGHAVGNLLIAALWQIHDDHVVGLDWIARLLRAHGRVLPMSSVPLTIEADVVTTPGRAPE